MQYKAESERIASEQEKIEYACLHDGHAATERIEAGLFHEIAAQIQTEPICPRGQPGDQWERPCESREIRPENRLPSR